MGFNYQPNCQYIDRVVIISKRLAYKPDRASVSQNLGIFLTRRMPDTSYQLISSLARSAKTLKESLESTYVILCSNPSYTS